MTRRPRPPTDEQETEVSDSPGQRAHRQTRRGMSRHADDLAEAERRRDERRRRAAPSAPEQISQARERSEPIRVISMKDAPAPAEPPAGARQHKVRLRALSELSGDTPASGVRRAELGFLAPPRDARAVRTRRLRDLVVWGSVVVALAGAVTLGVWLLAR